MRASNCRFADNVMYGLNQAGFAQTQGACCNVHQVRKKLIREVSSATSLLRACAFASPVAVHIVCPSYIYSEARRLFAGRGQIMPDGPAEISASETRTESYEGFPPRSVISREYKAEISIDR